MKQKKINTQEIFSLFVGWDDCRPFVEAPFEINGKIYATDLSILIRTDKANCNFQVDNKHELPDVEFSMPNPNTNEFVSFSSNEFEKFKTADEYEYRGKNIECNDCGGQGQVEWNYKKHERLFECPECNGSGFSEERQGRETGRKTFNNSIVKLIDKYFHIKLFYKIFQVASMTRESIWLTYYSEETNQALFKVGDFEILIMPMHIMDDNTEYYDNVLEIKL